MDDLYTLSSLASPPPLSLFNLNSFNSNRLKKSLISSLNSPQCSLSLSLPPGFPLVKRLSNHVLIANGPVKMSLFSNEWNGFEMNPPGDKTYITMGRNQNHVQNEVDLCYQADFLTRN